MRKHFCKWKKQLKKNDYGFNFIRKTSNLHHVKSVIILTEMVRLSSNYMSSSKQKKSAPPMSFHEDFRVPPRLAFCPSFVCTSGTSGSPLSRSHQRGIRAIQASNLVSSLLRQWDLTGQVRAFTSSSSVSSDAQDSSGREPRVPFFEDQFLFFYSSSSSSDPWSCSFRCHGLIHVSFQWRSFHDNCDMGRAEREKLRVHVL